MRLLKQLFLPLAAASVLLSVLPFIPKESLAQKAAAVPKKELNIIADVFSMAQTSYVDEVPGQRLEEGALNGMMRTLDPYSQFLDARAYEELKNETQGEFAGIGLEVSVKGGVLHVISPLDDSPADRAGLKPSDVIQKIDEVVTKDMTLNEAVRKMRGKAGSAVRLTVLREGEVPPLEFSVTREVVKVRGVREAKLLDGGIGYIRISEFQEKTARDFREALESLTRQGMKGLIVDVRNNPGGLLYAAVDVAQNFIPEGKAIVSTKGRLHEKNTEHISHNKDPLKIHPFYLLVNKGSASGSEILAGALQDYGLAVLVGVKTYGQGCIQTLTPLADGGAVRITTSRYYTPNGRLIHEIGITPDVIVANDPKDTKDLPLEKVLELVKINS
jgi:carboxyl-terminal processing protease